MELNKMGNLLTITCEGNNEAIKELIHSWLIDDEDSVEDKVLDLSKIIPVNNIDDWNECASKWGSECNASNTQVYFEGESNPPSLANCIYFDTRDEVRKVAQEISKQNPELYVRYEYCDEDATKAGLAVYTGGELIEGSDYPYRQEDMISVFHLLWGRYDDFKWDAGKGMYVNPDEEMEM